MTAVLNARWILIFLLTFFLTPHVQAADLTKSLEYLAVQDLGRVKPFDTFARESLHMVYGKKTYEGRSATDVVFTWMLIPTHWDEQPILEIRHSGLREALKLPTDRLFYTPKELFLNERMNLLFQELKTQQDATDKLNPYYQAVQRLQNQMAVYHMVKTGHGLRVVPRADSDTWWSVAELQGPMAEKFSGITTAVVAGASSAVKGDVTPDKAEAVEKAVNEFVAAARAEAPHKYGTSWMMSLEVHYNQFHPLMVSWILYLISALFMIGHIVSGRSTLYKLSWAFLIGGFFLHTYGMVVRSILTGRPPVSNMYETVVWVPWGTILFSIILERTQKWKVLIPAASIVAVFCLILTDIAPSVLDASLQPLEPVLRSTFWLTTHVLIITISYAAFFLAFALGDLLLFYFLKDEKKYAQQIQNGVRSIYRCIQIGVVLLAAGIILGGIWADYSWGRFWGWDPKETWALIALLGYVAMLHGRMIGWIGNFGMAAGSILSFALVIMAWYGVNFVLGAGLHSYGFGAGGVEYVSAFVAVHVLFVVYVATVRHSRQKESK
jgi:cytochrome c-type biogenesis protein CcsB